MKKYLILTLLFLFSFMTCIFAQDASNIPVDSTAENAEAAGMEKASDMIAEAKNLIANEAGTVIATATAETEPISKFKIKTPDEKTEILVVKDHGDHETIEVNIDGVAFVMKARSNKEGSWKYKEFSANEEKTLIAEAKLRDNAFKLVDEKDNLLWKVKINGNKIKISDNENNKNAFELKRSDNTKIKCKNQSGKNIAKVKFYPENGKMKLKDASEKEIYLSKDCTGISFAMGVLAFTDIPAKYRAVIAAELIRQEY